MVNTQDNQWATVHNGQSIQVAFEKPLDRMKDITLYAREAIGSWGGRVDVYAQDTNQLVVSFENIEMEGEYVVTE